MDVPSMVRTLETIYLSSWGIRGLGTRETDKKIWDKDNIVKKKSLSEAMDGLTMTRGRDGHCFMNPVEKRSVPNRIVFRADTHR